MAVRNSIPADVADDVDRRISRVVEMLRAANDMAEQCAAGNLDGETLAVALLAMTRDGVRSLDACTVRLGGAPSGCFVEECAP